MLKPPLFQPPKQQPLLPPALLEAPAAHVSKEPEKAISKVYAVIRAITDIAQHPVPAPAPAKLSLLPHPQASTASLSQA